MFKGLGNLADMGKMLAKAQQLKTEMIEAQAELEGMTVEAEAGAGLVKVTANGKGKVQQVHIDPSLLINSEQGVLQDLIVTAVNAAKEKAEDLSREHTKKLSEKFGFPLNDADLGF
jgi:nucleoid-associated protein EbfC